MKIDSRGNYLRFPGVTVVSAIRKEDSLFWSAINELINQVEPLKSYYSPLPLNSYHMTTINIITELETGKSSWEQFIKSKHVTFEQLQKTIDSEVFQPKVTIQNLNVAGTISISLNLSKQHADSIYELANQYQLLDQVPQPFHVTLAYQYKEIDEENFSKIKRELEAGLDKIIKEHGDTILFDSHKLCYFKDMTAFVPWENPSEYPFEQSNVNVSSQSMFPKTEQVKDTPKSVKKTCVIL